MLTGRVAEDDQILYQTERYHTSTFGYDIPVSEDGWYLLVLKFSEVYFNAPNMKVNMKFRDIYKMFPKYLRSNRDDSSIKFVEINFRSLMLC